MLYYILIVYFYNEKKESIKSSKNFSNIKGTATDMRYFAKSKFSRGLAHKKILA